jgi:diphosphomevalonate decarboxylase
MIERIRAFREDTKLPIFFTLDAGPNIHLLYPKKIAEKVKTFIDLELIELCENGKAIFDQVGKGPVLIK